LNKYSYLGALRQYMREQGKDVTDSQAYSYLGDYIGQCKLSNKFKGLEIQPEDEVRMHAFEIAEVPFNELKAQEQACLEYLEKIIVPKQRLLHQEIGHASFKAYLKIVNSRLEY
jgi:hypothetical protein